MAFKFIAYTVGVESISPNTQQSGGVQGSHNEVELDFTLNSALRTAIAETLTENIGSYAVYRFDGHSGTGAIRSTEPKPLTVTDTLTYKLENWITRDGGNAIVDLVITILDRDGETEIEAYTYYAPIRFKAIPQRDEDNDYKSVSTLYEEAKRFAQRAEYASENAEEDAWKSRLYFNSTQATKFELEAGSTFVFDGGDAVRGGGGVVTDVLAAIQQIRDSLYPIGSLYINLTDSRDPRIILGFGHWERVKDVYPVAAGDIYDAGIEGGTASIKLTENHLPRISGTFQNFPVSEPTTQSPYSIGVDGHFSLTDATSQYYINKVSADSTQVSYSKIIDRVTYAFGKSGNEQDELNNNPPHLPFYMWVRVPDSEEEE